MTVLDWVRAMLGRVAGPGRADDVLGDLEESHRRRVGRRGRWVAGVQTAIEAGELMVVLLQERWRSKRRGRGARASSVVHAGAGVSWLDVKLGVRMLFRYPGLTAVGSVAMAVAIGLGAAWFELANDMTNPRLPLSGGDRVVGIQSWGIVPSGLRYSTLAEYVRWRDELESIEELGAFARLRTNLILADGRVEPVDGVEMSGSAFRLAGVAPVLGRPLQSTDEASGAPAVVVIGHDRWQRQFGGDPGVLGRTVKLGAAQAVVVGVMPEGFGFPENHDLWVPLRTDPSAVERRAGPTVKVFGRLAPGVTRAGAQVELRAIEARGIAATGTAQRVQPRVIPYVGLFFAGDNDASMFYVLHVLFPLLLTVVCANVATLVFARTASRAGEIAMRTALGASRRRIVVQLFAEALVLASVAAVIGLAMAAIGLRSGLRYVGAAAGGLPFWVDDGVAPATVLYVAVLAVLGGAIMGVVPALKATGRSVQHRLREVATGGTGLRFGGVWTVVIVFQVALTVALLPMAATGVLDAVRFQVAHAGLAADRYLVGFLMPEDRGPAADMAGAAGQRMRVAREEIRRRLAAEAAVGGVTFARELPGMEHRRRRIEVDDAALPAPAIPHEVAMTWIAPDYFAALDASLLAGRGFNSGDQAMGRAVIVNQSFVRDVLRGQNALERRIRYADPSSGPDGLHEIVGVAPDLGMAPADPGHAAGIYHPLPSEWPAWVAVRVRGEVAPFAPRLREIVAGVDPTLQVNDVQSLADAARRGQAGAWFRAALAGLVSAITLLLSAAGIFALMSFTVTQRTREIGIRSALGAEPRRIVMETFSRAAIQLGIGVLIGGALATLPGYPGERLVAVLAITAFVMFVGLLACGMPVRRALRIAPTEAVREG